MYIYYLKLQADTLNWDFYLTLMINILDKFLLLLLVYHTYSREFKSTKTGG